MPLRSRDPAAPGPGGSAPSRAGLHVGPRAVADAARRWAAHGDRRHLPGVLLRLADPAVAPVVAEELGPDSWRELLVALAAVGPAVGSSPVGGRSRGSQAGGEPGRAPAVPEPGRAPAVPEPRRAPAVPEPVDGGQPGSRGQASPVPDVPVVVGALAELVVAEGSGGAPAPDAGDGLGALPAEIDLATVTRAAGLVLLYPWLGDHAAAAVERHPRLDPVEVREAALALVVDPADPGLVHDPLVRLLAGRDDPCDGGDEGLAGAAPPAPLPELEAVRESADGVLAAFAALLPGFAGSTADFVRQAWVARLGLLETELDPVRLTAATHPLDVVLAALPYPRDLVRLPWSRVLSVRFRP